MCSPCDYPRQLSPCPSSTGVCAKEIDHASPPNSPPKIVTVALESAAILRQRSARLALSVDFYDHTLTDDNPPPASAAACPVRRARRLGARPWSVSPSASSGGHARLAQCRRTRYVGRPTIFGIHSRLARHIRARRTSCPPRCALAWYMCAASKCLSRSHGCREVGPHLTVPDDRAEVYDAREALTPQPAVL